MVPGRQRGVLVTTVEQARAACEQAGRPVVVTALTAAQVAAVTRTSQGPLAGVPFAVKDNLDVQGVPTTGGCPALTEPATSSAGAVERLLDAGAVPVAKTNLDQFATGLVGTRSPFGACASVASPLHVSGGSSSGSAVAVASGLVPLALGTDTAGSGRVPAAFNGIVGWKPTRGTVSTRGLLPACRSLDCVTTLTRTVAEARAAADVLVAHDPHDAWSRAVPGVRPAGLAAHARVVGVPSGPLDLDPLHAAAWEVAVARLGALVTVVRVDVEPFLEAARLLYSGPWVAERYAAFGHLLEPDGPHLDPSVRQVVLGGRDVPGPDVFRGIERLAQLRAASEPVWDDVDALLLPVTPGHPTLAEVAADPLGVNSRLGTYTNFVNLLDLAAVTFPAERREDGLPFGVQLVGPAFADDALLELAGRWCGEEVRGTPRRPGTTLVAVVGAHLSGLPLNRQLLDGGGRLHARARSAGGARLYRLPGAGVPRPAMVMADGPSEGIALEVWELPHAGVGQLGDLVPAPLRLGRVPLSDGTDVLGFVGDAGLLDGALDVTASGGWRAHLRG
ncbi:MAG: Allophanate hydrolase [Frankiales bacterium]|nr:Allophanate hydrolase [Frankiales bacterium]